MSFLWSSELRSSNIGSSCLSKLGEAGDLFLANFPFGVVSLHSLFTLNWSVLPRSCSVRVTPVAVVWGLTLSSKSRFPMTLERVKTTFGFDSKRGIRKGSFIRLFYISFSFWGGCQPVPICFATFMGNLVPSYFFNSVTSSVLIWTGFNFLHWRFSRALAAVFDVFRFLNWGSIVINASVVWADVS